MGVSAEGEFPAGTCEGQAGKRLRASEAHFAKVRAGHGWEWGFWPWAYFVTTIGRRRGGGLQSTGLEAESEGLRSWNAREEGGAPGVGLPR